MAFLALSTLPNVLGPTARWSSSGCKKPAEAVNGVAPDEVEVEGGHDARGAPRIASNVSSRGGAPATTSMAPTLKTKMIAVPRSGLEDDEDERDGRHHQQPGDVVRIVEPVRSPLTVRRDRPGCDINSTVNSLG